jgi:hypothetical protein
MSKIEKKLQAEWQRGYVAAVANIIRTHKDNVIAKDVLRGAGNITWDNIPADNVKCLKMLGVI